MVEITSDDQVDIAEIVDYGQHKDLIDTIEDSLKLEKDIHKI